MQLTVNPTNPRIIKKEQYTKLKKSLLNFTKMLEVRPIAYDEDKIIWGGNMRYLALQELIKEGVVKDSPKYYKKLEGYMLEEKREFAIRDNVELGEWDDDVLANEWSDLPLDEWGVLTPEDWEKTLDDVESTEVDENRLFVLTVEAPEAPKLKERMAFYCETIGDYEKIKGYFGIGRSELSIDKLLGLLDETI
jgi:hypothetical protein